MSFTSAADADDRTEDFDHQTAGVVLKRRMKEAEVLILKWESEDSLPWDESEGEAFQYLAAVDDVLAAAEDGDETVLDKAETLLQSAMNKLEENIRLVLIRNTVPLDADRLLSFSGHDGAEMIGDDFGSFGEDNPESSERGASLGDNTLLELIRSKAVHHLREIAKRMIKSGYDKDCCKIYTSVRNDALDESLGIIGVEKVSIEDVEKMDWNNLDDKMKKWAQAVKIVVKVLLHAEKKLCADVFDGSELIQGDCFTEISKGCVMQLLNFGDAVSIAKRSSEKLFEILDMYDALYCVIPEIEQLFGDESGNVVRLEAGDMMKALGEAAMGALSEFEKQVRCETSRKPVQGGKIHPLTRYVMNYVKHLADCRNTLNQLLENYEDDLLDKNNETGDIEKGDMSPIGRRLLLLTSSLEKNLEDKSTMYEDPYIGFIFLMNNIRYMVQKVEGSVLANVLGDNWIRSRRGLTKQYANSYFRGCWSTALSFLKAIDSGSGTSDSALKVIVKERFKSFNTCFEDIYRTQTSWKIEDPDLRDDVQIMISGSVTLAYRLFRSRYSRHLQGSRHSEKYLKYSTEELESYLLDLFDGIPCDLSQQRRKN